MLFFILYYIPGIKIENKNKKCKFNLIRKLFNFNANFGIFSPNNIEIILLKSAYNADET